MDTQRTRPETQSHRHLYCPKCGRVLARTIAIDMSDNPSAPGALTICVHCLAPLQFPTGEAMFMVYADLERIPIRLRNDVLRTIDMLRKQRIERARAQN